MPTTNTMLDGVDQTRLTEISTTEQESIMVKEALIRAVITQTQITSTTVEVTPSKRLTQDLD